MHTYPENPQKVYYFGTCLVDMFYPGAGMAGIKLLQQKGIKVIFPSQQTCCGQPAYNSGFPDEARTVARKQMDLFSEDYPIVVPSGSCAGMMRHHYPKLFENDPGIDQIKEFSERIFELSEFLVHALNIQLVDQGPADQSHLAFVLSCVTRNGRHGRFQILDSTVGKCGVG